MNDLPSEYELGRPSRTDDRYEFFDDDHDAVIADYDGHDEGGDLPDELTADAYIGETAGSLPEHELKFNLGRVAVLHEVSLAGDEILYNQDGSYDRSLGRVVDRAEREELPGRYVLEVATGEGNYAADMHHSPEAASRSQELAAVSDTIRSEVDLEDPGGFIDWNKVASSLLDKAGRTEGSEKDTLLVGAVMSSQFAPDYGARVQFLRDTLERGVRADIAAACERSNIALATDGPNVPGGSPNVHGPNVVHPAQRLASIFRMDQTRLMTYLDHVLPRATDTPDNTEATSINVKAAYREVSEQLKQGVTDSEARAQAEAASVAGDNVQGVLLDIHKAERFALEERFIEEQAQAVLGGPDRAHTPIGDRLEASRSADLTDAFIVESHTSSLLGYVPDLVSDLTKLRMDMVRAFEDLGAPAREKFSLAGVDTSNPAALTLEQRVNLRFQQLTEETNENVQLAQYLDYLECEISRLNLLVPDLEIINVWEIADDGAAIPPSAEEAVAVVLGAAIDSEIPDVTEDELAELAHRSRRPLMQNAKHNIQEFLATEQTLKDARLIRDETGRLQLTFESAVPPSGSIGQYSAATVNCPALNVAVKTPGLTASERQTWGSSNYIDRLAAVFINEAKARGIFNLRNYGLR